VEHNFHFKGKYMNQAMPATKGSIQCPQCRRQAPHLVINGSTTELPLWDMQSTDTQTLMQIRDMKR
jgi:hypothetical protein